MRTVNIGDKELGLRASPLALLYYQQEFKKDLLADLSSFQQLGNIKDGDLSGFDSVKLMQLIYVMNKADNFGKQFPGFEQWLSDLGSIDFADTKMIDNVIEEAIEGFFRSAGGTGDHPAKQKPKPKKK